jgi:hypothetical protein
MTADMKKGGFHPARFAVPGWVLVKTWPISTFTNAEIGLQ